jgi:hypothetical protein
LLFYQGGFFLSIAATASSGLARIAGGFKDAPLCRRV